MVASLCNVTFDNMITFSELQRLLETHCGQSLQLKLNDNRSTMCSVRWESQCTKVSLHRIFLMAPQEVIQSLASAIKQKKAALPVEIKIFIHQQLQTLDYSAKLNACLLQHQGDVYNLKFLYDDINSEYFDGILDLHITWFGTEYQLNKRQFTFGLYYDTLRLIKINRMLDAHAFPEYVIRYVIYHEMLHSVCPAHVDKAGINRAHNREFKLLEKRFKEFLNAKLWVQQHLTDLFQESLPARMKQPICIDR